MFRIPNYFQMNLTWDEAVSIIRGRGDGTLIGGMEDRLLESSCCW